MGLIHSSLLRRGLYQSSRQVIDMTTSQLSVFFVALLLYSQSVNALSKHSHHLDPSTPDETDLDVIDSYLNPGSNRKGGDEKGSENESATTPPKPNNPRSNTSEADGHCKCLKYYECNVDNTSSGSNNDTSGGGEGGGPELLGVVDVRRIELKNSGNSSAAKGNDTNIECPHYFDVCCPVKNAKLTAAPDDSKTNKSTKASPPPQKETWEHTTCGHRNLKGVGFTTTGATQGEAQFGEFPWTVALIQLEPNEDKVLVNKYIGGGSLLHPKVVLTVAHNVLGRNRSNLRVRLGEWDTQTTDEPYPSQDRAVAKVIVHDQFLRKRLYNDVALLILDDEVRLAPNVDTICLPPLNRKLRFEGQMCYAAGWGKDSFGAEGRYAEILKSVSVPIVPKGECEKILGKSERLPGFRMHKSFLCAGGSESGQDTCKGDGGAALVCSLPSKNGEEDKHYVQVGAVSWGLGCGSKLYPGVYSDITYLTPWILKQLEKERISNSFCSLKD